jgi:putative hydrolase of the HAD superfamily
MTTSATLPPAILFDLDDTILDYSGMITSAWESVCREFAPSDLEPMALARAILQQSDWYWADPARHQRGRLNLTAARQEVVAFALTALGIDDPVLAQTMAQRRTELHDASIHPFPGALDTLHQLTTAGVRLALITNGAADAQLRKIDRFNLAPFFECLVVEGVFGVGKPDPRVFQHALTTLGVAPAQAWMVGDNLTFDIAPAQALGIYAVWNDPRGQGMPAVPPARPDRVIRTIAELI